MTAIRDLLHDADPVRHEAAAPADRERVRRAVLSAAETQAPPSTARGRLAIAAALAAVVLLAAVGVRMWPGGATLHAAAVRFDIRLAESEPTLGLTPARVAGSNRTIYLHRETVVTNDEVALARVIAGRVPQEFHIAVTLTTAGGEKMRAATSAHIGRPVALMVDGAVISAPVVRSAIGTDALLTGTFTRDEATRIAEGMLVR